MAQLKLVATACVILTTLMSAAIANDIINSKNEFIQKIAGKKIKDPKINTWMMAQPNGQINGKYRGINIKGKWSWDGAFWCRTARIGLISLPKECQQITLKGNTLILTRKRGSGSSHTYQLNGN